MRSAVFPQGTIIVARDGLMEGVATGSSYPCRMEGCIGLRISVKWPDGKHTFPCSKGLKPIGENRYQIM